MNKSIIYCCFFLMINFVIQAQNPPTVTVLQSIKLKKTSIRAIEVLNDSTLWFAGANGRYGRIVNDHLEIDSISHEGRNPSFRSIAYNGKHIFILSIEDPALLYKIDPNLPLGMKELVYKESDPKVFYDSMTFFDHENGIAMGDPVENCLSIIKTTDGGDHWTKHNCKDLPAVDEGEAAFAASNTNITTYKDKVWIATGGKKARVFISDKQLKNWNVFETPIDQGGEMTGIFSIDFYDKNLGIIMGGNWDNKKDGSRSKAITLDGGQTWALTATDQIPGYISCVQFVPGKSGKQVLAVSTEGIYFSNDSAKTWIKVENKGYYSLRFTDHKTAWLSVDQEITKIKLSY